MDILDLVPSLLSQAMRQQGWASEREMARHLGCSNASVINWRNGYSFPNAEYVAKLAGYAGYSPIHALIAAEILRSTGKAKAIYRRHLDDLGGLPPFPSLTNRAA